MFVGSTALGSPAAIRGTTNAQLFGIPSGTAGAVETMKRMRQLVRDAIRDPKQQIRETALAIVGNARGYSDQVRAIQTWVQNHINYVRDPPDTELIQTPQYTLQHKAGDCDDQSILVSALLETTGHPSRFIAVGLSGGPLSHVLVQTLIGQQWVGVETILNKPLGWMPEKITRYYILKV